MLQNNIRENNNTGSEIHDKINGDGMNSKQ